MVSTRHLTGQRMKGFQNNAVASLTDRTQVDPLPPADQSVPEVIRSVIASWLPHCSHSFASLHTGVAEAFSLVIFVFQRCVYILT